MNYHEMFGQTDTLNRVGENSMRQGYWIIYGQNYRQGEYPVDGKVEEGNYVDDRKNGEWIKYYRDGQSPRLKGNYEDNWPNGIYIMYYQDGKIMEEGTFAEGQRVQVFRRYFRSGRISQEKFYNSESKEHGKIIYYYDSLSIVDTIPRIEFQYFKMDGVTEGLVYNYYYSGCIRSVTMDTYLSYIDSVADYVQISSNDSIGEFCDNCDLKASFYGTRKDSCSTEIMLPASNRQPITYSRKVSGDTLYHHNGQIWRIGRITHGGMKKGQIYRYNVTGELVWIEKWRRGKCKSVIYQ